MSHDSSLEPILRAVEPAVRLIPERYLRQVLDYLIDWGHPLPANPKLPYWVSRDDLVAGDLLPAHIMTGSEPELLLITDADDRMIDGLPREVQLKEYWRLLFQAAVMREIDRKVAAGTLTEADCLERLERFGLPAAREIRSVLLAEHLISREANAVARFRAFAATYLDLIAFASRSTEEFFPSLPRGDAVARALAEDLDVRSLLDRCRPAGTAGLVPDATADESSQAAGFRCTGVA